MTFSTLKWNVLIINWLDPFNIIMKETYHIRQGLIEVHVDADSSIRDVAAEFCFLCYFNKLSQYISNFL